MSPVYYTNGRMPRFHFFFAGVTAFISFLGIIGWLFQIRILVQTHAETAPMVFNTAFGLFIYSSSYILKRRTNYILLRISSIIIATLALMTMAEYILGVSTGVDQLFVEPFFDSGINPVGRMSLSTCVSFLVLAVMGFSKKKNFTNQMVLVVCSALLISFALIALFGYVLGFNSDYGWGSYSRMAMGTSTALIFMVCAFLWQVKTDTSAKTASKDVLYPFFAVFAGIIISMAIWQMLVAKDQERNRGVTLLKAESAKTSIDGNLVPFQKALQRMAARFAHESYPTRRVWEQDAAGYFDEFQAVFRLIWSDNTNVAKWVYPLNDESKWIVGRNLILPHRDIKKNTVEIYREFEDSMALTSKLSGGETGFVFQTPSFKNDEFIGAISAVVLAQPFFESVIDLPGYSVEILKGDTRIYSKGDVSSFFAREWRVSVSYDRLGVNWEIVVIPNVQEIRQNTSALPAFILFFSISISILFGVSLRFYIRARDSERKAKEALEWKRAGIDSASLLVVSSDLNGRIVEVNAAAQSTLEYSLAELHRLPSSHYFFDAEEVRQFHALALLERNIAIHSSADFLSAIFSLNLDKASEWTLISKTNKRHKVVLTVSKIHGPQGEVTGYLSIMENVTQLREKELLLAEQEEQLQISSRLASLGEMAAGIAHEINNPLTVIAGHASIIRRTLSQRHQGDEDLIKKVDSIESMVQRIAKIIKGLKFYAREPDDAELELVNFQVLMDDTLSFCEERFKKEGVELKLEIEPHLILHVQPYKITQVLLNLLNNSLDAVIGAPHALVEVKARSKGDHVEICIRDSGPGVPSHIRKKIMEPFFTTKEVGKGLGLGLSISSGIVNAHQGTLTLDETSKSTQFILRLPKSSNPSQRE